MTHHRIALAIRYQGTAYQGWQKQQHTTETIQHQVEKALSFVANQPVTITCAGRTDAGVHATGQVVHFDTSASRTEQGWVFGANSHLPPDIRVLWAHPVPETFNARFSAQQRRYRYLLLNQNVQPGILRHNVAWYHRDLDECRMHNAAQVLVGEQDFSAFRGAACQSHHAIREITRVSVQRRERLIEFDISGNAFLLHMVRNIVGSLIEVGNGHQPVAWLGEVLASRNRCQAGPTAAPHGLYLVEVTYPDEIGLPKLPIGPFFLTA